MSNGPRHKRHFDGGRSSPQEYHAKHAFPANARCQGCTARPTARAITMAPFDECLRRMPELEPLLARDPQAILARTVPIRESGLAEHPKPYLRLGIAYSCPRCLPALERTLARAPSWMIVEINRGPADRTITS